MKAFWNISSEYKKGITNIKASNSFNEDATYEEFNNLIQSTFTEEELTLINTANLPYVYNENYGGVNIWWFSTEDDYKNSCECNPYIQDGKRVIFFTVDEGPGYLIFFGIKEFVKYLKNEFDSSTCNW